MFDEVNLTTRDRHSTVHVRVNRINAQSIHTWSPVCIPANVSARIVFLQPVK